MVIIFQRGGKRRNLFSNKTRHFLIYRAKASFSIENMIFLLRKRKKDSFDFHILKVAYLFQIMLFIAVVGPGSTAMVNLSEYTEQF